MLADGARWTKRHTFVIDEKGKLRAIEREVKVDSHGEDLIELIDKLRR